MENRRIEARIIALTSIGHCLCHLGELAFAGLIPTVMLEFGLPEDRVTLLAIPGLVLFGFGALPSGIWADRRSSYEALTGFFLLVIVACVLVYVSTSPLTLCLALTFLGAAISIYHPAGLSMISHGCQNRGRAMGINGVAGSLGVALGPSMAIYVASRYPWRTTYLIVAVVAAFGFAASLLLGKGLKQIGHHGTTVSTKDSEGQPIGVFAILFVTMLLGGINYRCMMTALPSFLSLNSGGISQPGDASDHSDPPTLNSGNEVTKSKPSSNGSAIVFLVLFAGGIGQLLGGFLADRYRPAMMYCCAIMLTIPFALLIGRSDSHSAPVFAVLFAIFMFAEQPLENTMIAEATATKWRSTVYGLKFIFAFGLASLGVYIAGFVWRYYGLVRVFDVYAIGAMSMALFGILYWALSNRAIRLNNITNSSP